MLLRAYTGIATWWDGLKTRAATKVVRPRLSTR